MQKRPPDNSRRSPYVGRAAQTLPGGIFCNELLTKCYAKEHATVTDLRGGLVWRETAASVQRRGSLRNPAGDGELYALHEAGAALNEKSNCIKYAPEVSEQLAI